MDVANVRIHNSVKHPFQVDPFAEVEVFETGTEFSLQNGYIKAGFSPDGILQALTSLDDKQTTDVKLEFVRYGTRKSGDKSGAYLFLPDGHAKPLPMERPIVRIVEGKLVSQVTLYLKKKLRLFVRCVYLLPSV